MTPEVHLADPALLRDPFTAYGRVREAAPVARLVAPGFGGMWAVLRYDDARTMLADPRFELNATSYLRPEVPEHCLAYLRTMQEMDGPEHARLRRLVAPAFTARRAADLRPRIEAIVDGLLDGLPADGPVDLLADFARPLPLDVICELVGIPGADRPRWREYGAAVAGGHGQRFAAAIPAIIEDAKQAVARRSVDPGDDVLSDLLGVPGDRLTDTELVTLVWHLILAGQTPTNLIANAVDALLAGPADRDAYLADPVRAVEELTRWCGPQLLTIPRYAREDVTLFGVPVAKGEAVTAVIVAANRDPRAYADPDRLDLGRSGAPHLGYAHGPHFCLGAALARVQTEVALTAVLRRYPDIGAAGLAARVPDPGTWRLTSLPVTLG